MLNFKLATILLILTLTIYNVFGAPNQRPIDQDEIALANILNELTSDFIDPDDIFSELESMFDELNSQVEEIFSEISSVEGPFSLFLIFFD